MGIGRDTDAAIAALGAQLIAFTAARRVVEGVHRFCHAAFVIAAVISYRRPVVGLVRKIGALNEIAPTYLDLIDVEVPCNRVDRSFGDVGPFGPAIAAIGVNRDG